MKLATLALATLATVATVAETVKTASQPWVTNNVAQAVAPVAAGVATNAARIAEMETDVAALAAETNTYLTAETDPTVPAWAKASSKPGYTLNEICPEKENWLGVQGNAGRCIRVLAGTVGGNIVGGMRVTASTLNDNNMTTYTYGGVAVRRNGTNQDYLWDGSSTNGIVRRGELASVATSGSYNDLTNAPDLGQYSTTGAVAQVARDLSAVSNVAASAVQTETDPTVPSWAKASNKPSYTYSEISNTPDLSGYATTDALDNYLPLSGGVVTGNVFVAQQAGNTNAILAAVGEQTYGRFSVPAIGTYPDRSIDYEDERTIAALLKEDDMPLLRLERIKHGRYSTYFTNSLQTIEYEKAELDMDGLGHVRIDKDGNSVACDIRWPTPPEGTNYICGTWALREEIPEVPTEWDYTAITNAPWLTSYTETDPTVPSVANAATNYTDTVAARYLPLAGGELTGEIKIRAPAENSGYAYGFGTGTGGDIKIFVYDDNDVRIGTFTLIPSASLPGEDEFSDGIATTSLLATKQNAIADLSTIRSGAAAGATAVQQETDPTVPAWAKVTTPPYLTSETDPTVPSWAKVTTPPYLTSETDPTVPSWAKVTTPPYLTSETDAVALAEIVAATNALVRGPSVYFATCATAAATRAKVLVFDSADSSRLGDIATRGNTLFVKFDKAQTYNGVPQLSINGTTYLIYMVGTTGATRYEWVAGEVVQFVYDGERWMLVDAGRATTSYYGVTKLTTSVSSTSTSTALTPASLSGYIAGTIDDTPVYATNTAHTVGARARYGNYTWECTNAVAAGVAWNEADWRELPPLQAQIDDLRPSGPIATNSVVRATSGDACRVSLASGATLSAALDVEGVPVIGLIEPAGAYSVSPSIHLLGYGTWPTNSFQAVFWKVGQTTFANVLSEL